MITARQIAVNKAKSIAYIFDDGSNAPERLIQLDLTNGDRKSLYEFNTSHLANSLILDEDNRRLFTQLGNMIGIFDLKTQTYKEFYDVAWGAGEYVNSLVFDKSRNRLLFNSNPGVISSLDLATNTIAIAYSTTEGNDIKISGSLTMALDTKRDQLLIKSYSEGKLFSLNLKSGKRQLLLDKCVDERNFDQLSRDTHTEMVYDANNDYLIFNGEFKLVKIAVETAQCTFTKSATAIPLDVWPMTADTALETSFNSVHLVDFKTEQSVIISR